MEFNVDECTDAACVNVLEHVTLYLKLDIKAGSIGDFDIVLISPSKTISFLLTKDLSNRKRKDDPRIIEWTFMSVHFWGELSHGTWTAEVNTDLPQSSSLGNWFQIDFNNSLHVCSRFITNGL